MGETSEPFGRFEQRGPLTLIAEGMRVYDYAGEEIGTVERVFMGAANKGAGPGQVAATASPAGQTDGGLIEDVARAFLPQETVPEALRACCARASSGSTAGSSPTTATPPPSRSRASARMVSGSASRAAISSRRRPQRTAGGDR